MEKILRTAKKNTSKVIITFKSGRFTQPLLITDVKNGIVAAVSANSDAQYPRSYFLVSEVSLVESNDI